MPNTPDDLPPRKWTRRLRHATRRRWLRFVALLHGIPADLAWYGLCVAGSVGGFSIQIMWKSARDAGVGAIIIMISIAIGLGRYLASRISRLGDAVGVSPLPIAYDHELSPVALRLYGQEVKRHRMRAKALREGALILQTQDEMLEDLYRLSRVADEEMWAVDFVALEHWFGDQRFRRYLDLQFERARNNVVLCRLRFVRRAALEVEKERVLLREFIRLHDAVDAQIRLCYVEVGQSIPNLVFFPPKGTLIIDPRSSTPACLSGQIGDQGHIETTNVYLRSNDPLQRNIADWRRLWREASDNGWDGDVRRDLTTYVEDPLFAKLDLREYLGQPTVFVA